MQLQLSEEVSNRDPSNAQQRREVAIAHAKGGRLDRLRGAYDQSLKELDVAASIMQALVAKEPQRKEWHRDLAHIQVNRAWTLLRIHRAGDAA